MRAKVLSFYLAPDLEGSVKLYYACVYVAAKHLSLYLYRHPLSFEVRREKPKKALAIGHSHCHARLELPEDIVVNAEKIADKKTANRRDAPALISAVVKALMAKGKVLGGRNEHH